MSHALSREFETIIELVRYQYQTKEGTQWIASALLGVLDALDDYWDTVDNVDESEWENDYQGKKIDEIWETIHAWLVHNEIPKTEAEIIAEEDQAAAELRDELEKFKNADDIKVFKIEDFLKKLVVDDQDGEKESKYE